MVVKTQFSSDELRFMLSHYNRGIYIDAQPISSGTVQTVMAVESTEGNFILKYYENRTPESVAFETNLLVYIGKRDFPCAAPIRNRKNGFYALYKGKPFVFYEHIDGTPITTPQPYHQSQIIHAAAMLQNYTRNYIPKHRHYRWNYNGEFCQQMIDRARTNITDKRFIIKADWYQQQLDNLILDAYLPKSICHCDYDYSNILWQGDDLIALIDFDDANLTYMVMDLIYLLDMWAWNDYQFDLHRAIEIIDQYTALRKLSFTEMKYFYDVHKFKILIDSIWFFHGGNPDDFPGKRHIKGIDTIGYTTYTRTLFGAKYLR